MTDTSELDKLRDYGIRLLDSLNEDWRREAEECRKLKEKEARFDKAMELMAGIEEMTREFRK